MHLHGPRLSFDDGPSESTDGILDLLAEYDMRAHFFVIGLRAEERPDLIERAAAQGHVIGNHTWDHAGLVPLSDDHVIDKLARANQAIESILGTPPRLFRAPYGSVDHRVERLAATLGLTHMGWHVDTIDYEASEPPERIAEAIVAAASREIVLLHDGNGDIPSGPHGRSKTVEALGKALPDLCARFP